MPRPDLGSLKAGGGLIGTEALENASLVDYFGLATVTSSRRTLRLNLNHADAGLRQELISLTMSIIQLECLRH